MKYKEPDIYKSIVKKLQQTKKEREKFIAEFVDPIKKEMLAHGFDFEVKGRPKSIHSIWNKMKKQNVPFEEVYDLFAIRIIINSP